MSFPSPEEIKENNDHDFYNRVVKLIKVKIKEQDFWKWKFNKNEYTVLFAKYYDEYITTEYDFFTPKFLYCYTKSSIPFKMYDIVGDIDQFNEIENKLITDIESAGWNIRITKETTEIKRTFMFITYKKYNVHEIFITLIPKEKQNGN